MPEDRTISITLPPDGSRVAIPAIDNGRLGQPDGKPGDGLRVEIQGVFRCAYNNQAYDAVYQFGIGDAANPAQQHSYLAWQPYPPVLEESDVAAHRYVFRFPRMAAGVSPTVRVDADRFVNEFLIPPSEVRSAISGQFTLTVRAAAPAAVAPWPIALAAVPALAVLGGVVWVIQRRMAVGVLDLDLEAQLARVQQKADAARGALGREDARLTPIRKRLKSLEAGALLLARQIAEVRNGCKHHSQFALERDIAALEREQTAGALSEDQLLTLAGKRKTLASLTDLEKAEGLLATRLNRAEAVLESTLAGLQTVKTGAMAAPISDSLCRSLDSEVSALREAARPQPEQILLGRVDRG